MVGYLASGLRYEIDHGHHCMVMLYSMTFMPKSCYIPWIPCHDLVMIMLWRVGIAMIILCPCIIVMLDPVNLDWDIVTANESMVEPRSCLKFPLGMWSQNQIRLAFTIMKLSSSTSVGQLLKIDQFTPSTFHISWKAIFVITKTIVRICLDNHFPLLKMDNQFTEITVSELMCNVMLLKK